MAGKINMSPDPDMAWLVEPPPEDEPPKPETEPDYRFTPGGSFILDTDREPKALWGEGDQVLWADGEALIIAGAQGLGKTTLAQQVALGWCGFDRYTELLGFPIEQGTRVLYLAMDRPRQAARSFRRMVSEDQRDKLDERLAVWQGPPPGDLAKYPQLLLRLCDKAYADVVIVDSLKDAAIGLSEDDVGAGYNRARQIALTAGAQVVEQHHIRKAQNSRKADADIGIDDLYGSTWITSGAGSVILLTGKPGDPIVRFQHVKQPPPGQKWPLMGGRPRRSEDKSTESLGLEMTCTIPTRAVARHAPTRIPA